MINRFETNRPSLQDIPAAAVRLFSVSRRAESYLPYANEDMREAGLRPSSREGIWLYIAEESLAGIGHPLTIDQKAILLDLFTVLRRTYKSADDAWNQSHEVRDYVIQDPLARVTDSLSWSTDGASNITDLSPTFNYLQGRLTAYFTSDKPRQERVSSAFESFVKNAAWALVDFERLKQGKQPDWQECFEFYNRTTAGIGLAIGNIVGEVVGADEGTKKNLRETFRKASLISQLVDDIVDSPLDSLDENSPSVVKAALRQYPDEYDAMLGYANSVGGQISHRIFRQIAPQTDNAVNTLYASCLEGIPPAVQRFLRDFYSALPPMAVSHADPLNKSWHTSIEANRLLREYVQKHQVESPYRLVDFISLTEKGDRRCQLGILIDPDKQEVIEAAHRAQTAIQQGSNVVLIGGSGMVDSSVFKRTVEAITEITQGYNGVSVLVFPGHIEQIPLSDDGIKGILNYSNILGSPDGNNFERAYPLEARRYVKDTFKKRGLRSISTLYVLCGNPNSSVSRVTGILPLDNDDPTQRGYLLQNIAQQLRDGVACVYLECGSGASYPIPPNTVAEVKQLIQELSPQTLLFVGGGISKPEHVSAYANNADCIVVGTHFETQGTDCVGDFTAELK